MLQLELGPEIEARVVKQANRLGVSVDTYVKTRLVSELPESQVHEKADFDAETVERRTRAAKELATFAQDRGINIEIPEGMTMREYIRDACGF
jgi:hypothetical protein